MFLTLENKFYCRNLSFANPRTERVVQCQLDQKYQLAIELGLRFEDFDRLTLGHHKSYLIGGNKPDYAVQLR